MVLVVDDEDDERTLTADVLRSEGYDVVTAANGREALTKLEGSRPVLILLDVYMPDMDGAEFRQAQRRDPDLIAIPTVVMTGRATEPVLDPAIKCVLVKPFSRAALLDAVSLHATAATTGTM